MKKSPYYYNVHFADKDNSNELNYSKHTVLLPRTMRFMRRIKWCGQIDQPNEQTTTTTKSHTLTQNTPHDHNFQQNNGGFLMASLRVSVLRIPNQKLL